MRRTQESFDIIQELAIRLKSRHAQLYFFGGYMRDVRLGKDNSAISDIDIKVIGITKAEFLTILFEVAKKYRTEPYVIDGRFEIIKLNGFDIDFSSPENEDGTIRKFEDIKDSFDFTINAFLRNVRKSHVIDEHGGQKDLENKCIRLVRPEIEEPFLAIRAAKLRAKLARKHNKNGKIIFEEVDDEWSIDDESREIMLGYDYADLNYQRLKDLLKKVMTNPEYVQSVFFRELLSLSVLEKALSPLEQLDGLQVDVNGRKMDAFEHTVRMLDHLLQFKFIFLSRVVYKDRLRSSENFEALYMMCLTYHFREMYKENNEIRTSIRDFLTKLKVSKKTKATAGYCVNNEHTLVGIYNNFYDMSDEELAKIYVKHREKLEYIGYFVESYNLAGIDNLTLQQHRDSQRRLLDWKLRIQRAKEMSIRTIKLPTLKAEPDRYTLSTGKIDAPLTGKRKLPSITWKDIGGFTGDLPDADVGKYLNGAMAEVVRKSTNRHSRKFTNNTTDGIIK